MCSQLLNSSTQHHTWHDRYQVGTLSIFSNKLKEPVNLNLIFQAFPKAEYSGYFGIFPLA